jgi:hypothetical protein
VDLKAMYLLGDRATRANSNTAPLDKIIPIVGAIPDDQQHYLIATILINSSNKG